MPRFLNKTERRVAFAALLVALITGGALGYKYLSNHASASPAAGGSYTEGLVGSPALINPLYASASDVDNDLAHLIFSGLLRYDPREGLTPDLASSFTISPDGKTYTFTLRDNIVFHNGDPLTSYDVAFTIHAIQNPSYRSPLINSFSGVDIQTPDEKTVIFVLPSAFTSFASFLTVGILPAHVWEDIQPGSAELTQLNIKPIGTGPYHFEKLTKDSKGTLRSMILARNENFYREVPYISELNFKFYNSADELGSLLRNRNIEGAVTLPFNERSRFSADSSVNLVYAVLPEYMAAFFNLNSVNTALDLNVRKALSIGTDRQRLIDTVLNGKANALTAPFLNGMPGGTAPESVAGADVTSAATMLDAAGWKIPDDGSLIRQKSGKILSVTIALADTPDLTAVADELKKQWTALGVEVTVSPLSTQMLSQTVLESRNFDILLAGELYSASRDPYPYWHSSQTSFPGLNVTGFSSHTADEAMNTIRTSPDENKRLEAYATLAKTIADQAPAVFLYQPTYVYAVASNIKGIDLPEINLPSDRFTNVNTWYIKTKPTFK